MHQIAKFAHQFFPPSAAHAALKFDIHQRRENETREIDSRTWNVSHLTTVVEYDSRSFCGKYGISMKANYRRVVFITPHTYYL